MQTMMSKNMLFLFINMKSIFFSYHSTLNGKIHGEEVNVSLLFIIIHCPKVLLLIILPGQECWGFNTRVEIGCITLSEGWDKVKNFVW